MNFDLIVIGSGPGGYVAAVRASQLGLKTAIVERETDLGGVCLNWGCIPTKALLTASGLLQRLGTPGDLGLTGEIKGDYGAVMKRSRQVVKRLTMGIAALMKAHNVTVLHGQGCVEGPGKVTVTTADSQQPFESRFILLAAGAKAREIPGVSIDGDIVLSSKEILALEKQPESLLVIGGGAIGVEFADFYASMGTKVTLVEAKPRILPLEDEDVSALLSKLFQKRGMELMPGTTTASVVKQKNGLARAELVGPDGTHASVEVEKVLVGIGVSPNVSGLLAEGVSVETGPGGFVKVGASFETSLPGVFAIGDLIGAPLLAHAASQEARAAVGGLAGRQEPWPEPDNCPGCVYTHPEIASVGQTEAALKAAGTPYKTGKVQFRASGRAQAAGEVEGFVKVLVDPTYHSLLGAHLIGAGVSELIAPLVVMKTAELSVEDMMAVTFPHPTLSEAVYHALSDSVGLRTD